MNINLNDFTNKKSHIQYTEQMTDEQKILHITDKVFNLKHLKAIYDDEKNKTLPEEERKALVYAEIGMALSNPENLMTILNNKSEIENVLSNIIEHASESLPRNDKDQT